MFSATTKEAANATLNDAKLTAASAKRDINNQTGISRDFSSAARDVSRELESAANKAGRQVRGFVDNAGHQISDVSHRVTGEIRNNPVRSSAIALGVGFVIGALFRR